MIKKILSYQTNAINACIDHLLENKEFRLQSPTGSGKTFIISQIIDKYLENDILNSNLTTFLFIAPSTGKLDYQGYEKITSYLKRDWAKGYNTEYIGISDNKSSSKSYLSNIDHFKENTCYFIGWQMFKKGTKITEIDSEKNDIYKVIFNTKDRNINIVLIIDEAHREIVSKEGDINVKENILKYLDPYKTIKVSATLEQVKEEVDYKITYDDVRQECAIKQNVIIQSSNNDDKNYDKYSENQQLIMNALKKQKEIKEAYFKHNINIRPLILIQILDNIVIENKISTEELLLKEIESFLESNNYKRGFNYAIWLDKLKTNKKEEILDNNSNIEILIFKTAIATGWDIPRANILVRIRDAKTKSFNIQTLGRILRNPFFKYFNNELIDNAFVYTKDTNYENYIMNESIVTKEENYINVERSEKANNSLFSLNKILIDKKYDDDKLINYVVGCIYNNKDFEKIYFNYKDKENDSLIKISKTKIDSKDIVETNDKYINKEIGQQTQFDFNKPKLTLFDIYIKFKTITKDNSLITRIINEIENNLHSINKKIKEFYLATIFNYKESLFKIDGNHLNLKELINYHIKEFQSKEENTQQKIEIFNLPKEYKINTKFFDNHWDKCSSFLYTLKELDSKNEEEFYDLFKSKFEWNEKKIHIFRNGTNYNIDYYIEYISNDGIIKKFFPDFIVVNEEIKEVWIFEAKGKDKHSDIDRDSKEKFESIVKLIESGSINNKTDYYCNYIYRVYYDETNKKMLFYENDGELKNFKDIYDVIIDFKK